MNDITISKCGTCGQDMRPTDYTERHQQVLEAKDKEIERLKGMVDEIQAARYINREHDKLLVKIAKYKALCDQLGGALELGWSPVPRKGVDARELAMEALDKYREMK